MVFDIKYLKKIRKQLNLTQHQFAKEAGISQSMVAKIEAGTLDPTYSYVQKIESAIARLTKNEEKKAADIMHEGIIACRPEDSLHKVMTLFAHHNISQIPIMERQGVLGLISESNLIGLNESEIKEKKALYIASESPPIVSGDIPISAVAQLLKFYPIVLVSIAGKLKGVITKADIIKTLAEK